MDDKQAKKVHDLVSANIFKKTKDIKVLLEGIDINLEISDVLQIKEKVKKGCSVGILKSFIPEVVLSREASEKKSIKRVEVNSNNPMSYISNYQVISAKTPAELTTKVKQEMAKAWVPYGGVSSAYPPIGAGGIISSPDKHFQAMVRF